MEERRCLECGEPLRGRADQKYCNDLCRNAYNNKKLSGSSNFIRKTNRILKKNHAILEELNPEDKPTTLKSILEKNDGDCPVYFELETPHSYRVLVQSVEVQGVAISEKLTKAVETLLGEDSVHIEY